MQTNSNFYTKHARDRITARNIPPGIVNLILDYGEPVKARDDAIKFALGKKSMRNLKHEYGRSIVKALAGFRNVYVVMRNGRLVTVARSKTPLVH
jgi:hypothetical protein